MGGTTSKFEETDWAKANGKLETSQDTLDSALPTSKYQVFHLIKRGVNQREFDVTDEQDNLLYTTRQVPGTISCFDVLGKEMDSFLLRVNVDLARRYWTIHRYQVASFEGQEPDKVATEKVAAERLMDVERSTEPMRESFNTPLLFRKACVIVSWSRYMAVATMFGTPAAAQLAKYNEPDVDTDDETEAFELHDSAGATKELKSIFGRASSRITERIRARTSLASSAKSDYYKPIKITGVNNPNALNDDDNSDNSSSSSFGGGCNNSEGVEVSLEEHGVERSSTLQMRDGNEPPGDHSNTDTVESITAMSDKPEIKDTVDVKYADGCLNDKSEGPDADNNSGTDADTGSSLIKNESTGSDDAVLPIAKSAESDSGVMSNNDTTCTAGVGNVNAAATMHEHDGGGSTTIQASSNNEPNVVHLKNDTIESITALSKPEIAKAIESQDSSHLSDKVENPDADIGSPGTHGTGSSFSKNESTSSDVVALPSARSAESGCSANSTKDSACGYIDATTMKVQDVGSITSTSTTDKSALVCTGPPPDPDEVPSSRDGTEEATDLPPQRNLPERPCNNLSKSAPPQAIPKRSRPDSNSGTNFDTDAARASPKTIGADVGKWILHQSRTFRDTYSRPKKPKKEDPMEGVIRLDQPLVLCQEIYTKLIGNHQTSLVSKEKVLELLQQDEAQHQQEKKDKGGNDDGENPELTQEILDSVAELSITDDDATNDDNDSSPGNGVAEYKSNNDTETTGGLSDEEAAATSTNNPTQEEDKEQPLVGYWKWENTFRTHKMKMHLAKGSDLALHVVLAIVVNQVRYERNAVAITI